MFEDIIVPLLAFVIVLILCFYTTKFIGRKFAGDKKNKTMRIVETLSLGLDRCLYLIQVGKKYLLFHSSKKGMEFVSEIQIDEQTESDLQKESDSTNAFEFKKIFDAYSGLSQKSIKDEPDHNVEGPGLEASGIMRSIKRLQRININKE